ncbi:hypothetical protein B0J14DRAFT_18118 [Halenospora varia]|nr:hypothetical protein B0J14DRAFT_18118 [Halenospora varia]
MPALKLALVPTRILAELLKLRPWTVLPPPSTTGSYGYAQSSPAYHPVQVRQIFNQAFNESKNNVFFYPEGLVGAES